VLSTVLDRELDADKSLDPSGPHIRCPLCGWSPRKEDLWSCSCGHVWNTFDTGGVCPACVLYPNREGTKFDMAYYLNHHIPMVRQLLGLALKGVSVERGISGEEPGSPAPYVTTCHLLFDSVQAFQTSFGPHAQETMEDIPKYTNSEPLIQIGEVKL